MQQVLDKEFGCHGHGSLWSDVEGAAAMELQAFLSCVEEIKHLGKKDISRNEQRSAPARRPRPAPGRGPATRGARSSHGDGEGGDGESRFA